MKKQYVSYLLRSCYCRIITDKPLLALTFDDGPYPPYTEELLSLLAHYEVPATFFMRGDRIERYPETARAVACAGHQLANHSYSHQDMRIRSFQFITDEITRTDNCIRACGYDDEIVFRAPFARFCPLLSHVLTRLQKKHILFDFYPDPHDWQAAPVDAVVSSMLSRLRPGSILVLHDGNTRAAPLITQYSEQLIIGARAQGYEFVNVLNLLQEGQKHAS